MGYDMQWEKDGSDEGYFRANIWGMGTLRYTMYLAGVLDEEAEMPQWPERPKDLKEERDDDPRAIELEKQRDATRATRSTDPGKVPIFKFGSNDGWIVTPEESRLIADKVDAMLAKIDGGEPFVLTFDDKEDFVLDAKKTAPERMKFVKDWAVYNRKCADAGMAYRVW